MSVDNRGSVTVVIASGEDAIWIEFGSGVYYNGSPGTSPHPSGAELGFVIGGYGDGNGKKNAWGYKDETGKVILTHVHQPHAYEQGYPPPYVTKYLILQRSGSGD